MRPGLALDDPLRVKGSAISQQYPELSRFLNNAEPKFLDRHNPRTKPCGDSETIEPDSQAYSGEVNGRLFHSNFLVGKFGPEDTQAPPTHV